MTPTRTYRCARGTISLMVVSAAIPALIAIASLVVTLRDPGVPMALMSAGFFAWAAFSGYWAAVFCRMRVRVGYDWIETRELGRARRIAFSAITAFSELRGSKLRGVHVSLFRLHHAGGPPLTFTSQLVGWAAVIDTLHQSVPWQVPSPARVHARRRLHPWRFDPIAAATVAPGQEIPEEWAAAGRVRWTDVLAAYAVAFVVSLAVAFPLSGIATRLLGRHLWIDAVTLVLAIGGSQLGMVALVALIRRRRLAAAEGDRLARRFEDPESGAGPSGRRTPPPPGDAPLRG